MYNGFPRAAFNKMLSARQHAINNKLREHLKRLLNIVPKILFPIINMICSAHVRAGRNLRPNNVMPEYARYFGMQEFVTLFR